MNKKYKILKWFFKWLGLMLILIPTIVTIKDIDKDFFIDLFNFLKCMWPPFLIACGVFCFGLSSYFSCQIDINTHNKFNDIKEEKK